MALIYLISFLLAANGLLVEYNLSQVLSAILGGTILRYHTSVGIFTFSLGLGSLIYPFIKHKFSDKKILITSNIFVGVISLLGPLFISYLDPLSTDYKFVLTVLCYFPIILLGISAGLEIPSLFSIISGYQEKLNRSQLLTLCSDYMGMVAISFVFPLLLVEWGVFKISYLSVALSALSFILLLKVGASEKKEVRNLVKKTGKGSLLIASVAFVTSFCSISYELILGKIFTDIQINEVYAHSITIGIYLLGLSLGALSVDKIKDKWLGHLIKAEFILVLTALFILPAMMFLFAFWKVWLIRWVPPYPFFFILQIFVVWIGYWSGKELPLCINLLSDKLKHNQSSTIAVNYFGALFAGFIVPILFLPLIGIGGGLFVVGFLNLTVLLLLILSAKDLKSKNLLIVSASLISLLFLWVPTLNRVSEQAYLKSMYHNILIPDLNWKSFGNYRNMLNVIDDVPRITTPYQYIDAVKNQLPGTGEKGVLTVYLNRQPQFSMDTWKLYHDSFSFGAVNLHGKVPQNVLLLGGGDGLLLAQLKKIAGIQKITMIELDQTMIEFSSKQYDIAKANEYVFEDKSNNIIIDDAYSWLKKNKKKFDAIFIDFPYPTSFEISRLYSVEFYKMVYSSLADKGFIVLDAPVSFIVEDSDVEGIEKGQILLSTLKAAGFHGLYPFGVVEPFIYAEKSERELNFSYDQLKFLENRSFVNLSNTREWFGEEDQKTAVINSIYHPLFLEFDL